MDNYVDIKPSVILNPSLSMLLSHFQLIKLQKGSSSSITPDKTEDDSTLNRKTQGKIQVWLELEGPALSLKLGNSNLWSEPKASPHFISLWQKIKEEIRFNEISKMDEIWDILTFIWKRPIVSKDWL